MWPLITLFLSLTWLLGRHLLRPYRRSALTNVPLVTILRFNVKRHLQSWLLWLSGVSHALPPLPDVEQLPGRVVRILGNNPSQMTLTGTNVYLLGTGSRRFLIDSSDGNQLFIKRVLDVCIRHGVREISDLLLTHGHLDHVGGILKLKLAFPKMKIWKYLTKEGTENDRRLHLSTRESQLFGIQPLKDQQTFQVPGGGVLTTVYTPGHCQDHVCFLLQQVDDCPRVLFSGDLILGTGSCVFDSLCDLMASLSKIQTFHVSCIYPGHGPVVKDAAVKIADYLTHRQKRETAILKLLKKNISDRCQITGLSSAEIVDSIYEPQLPFLVRRAARKAVETHLQKLVAENRVELCGRNTWWHSVRYTLTSG